MNQLISWLRLHVLIGLALLTGILAPAPFVSARTEHEQPPDQPHSAPPAPAATDRIIIKFKPDANILGSRSPNHPDRLRELGGITGTALVYSRRASNESHVLRLNTRQPLGDVRRIADRLMSHADVEYAAPDEIRHPTITPNDNFYSNQWASYDAFGVNAPGAWDITTGSTSVVIAGIDTGITNHSDLAGRTVPGYDFIDDLAVANDGDLRDADPSDPGDWITSTESASPGAFQNCYVTSSSWHGTHTAGTIGAAGNNAQGVAGLNWVSKILPVRVLGKCGGYDSDIIDGMRWAAGLSVYGVPANPNPAKVLNLSLGGYGSCPYYMQTAINEIVAAGVSIIVAAGNDNEDVANAAPANCSGVITVAATTRSGSRAYYSNFGTIVKISAPGGDSGNRIFSTYNTGTYGPVSDSYAYMMGTSMATPHITGIASLLYSISPSLTPAQVRLILQTTANPFPLASTCNTMLCGSGIADAAQAVNVLPRITATAPASVTAGASSFTLTVLGTQFIPGSIVKWNGAARSTNYINSGELRATILGTDITSPGTAQITVVGNHAVYGTLITSSCSFRVNAGGSFTPPPGSNLLFLPIASAGQNTATPIPGAC